MKLKKAIEIIEIQKQKVLSSEHPNNDEWIVETASYIKDFFGFKSVEYSRIAQFKWHVKTLNTTSDEEVLRLLEENKNNIILFLDNCKESLKNKGLFNQKKSNLLSDKSNAALIATIFGISTFVFGIGYYFGTEKINKDYIDNETELIEIKKLISQSSLLTEFENGRWISETDSLSGIEIKNKKWVMFYKGMKTDSTDIYEYKISQGTSNLADSQPNTGEFLSLTNSSDTLNYEILRYDEEYLNLMYLPRGNILIYKPEE